MDNGTELFGNYSPQRVARERNGFLALAEFDLPQLNGNSDGQIDVSDEVFAALRLWQDINHNGISEPEELHTLTELGLVSIDLDFKVSKRADVHGNRFSYWVRVKDKRDSKIKHRAWDVFLLY